MKTISFITLHPGIVEAYTRFGVFRAAERLGLHIKAIPLRNFAVDKHGSVDDTPFGGGDGMVLRPEPLSDAIKSVVGSKRVIYTSPSGRPWKQAIAEEFATLPEENLVFIAGRFAGIDQRFVDRYVDDEFTLGDFVVSGGELPCLMIADSILRQVPGVLGNFQSAQDDSFSAGMRDLLEYPLYTKPHVFEGEAVPEVLLSGDHNRISTWRKERAQEKTKRLRPDLRPSDPKKAKE